MSDGPHRSLPMNSGRKRVAERGANSAYASDEISMAIIPALEKDCRAKMDSELIDNIRSVFREQDTSLFKEDLSPQLEALRREAVAA